MFRSFFPRPWLFFPSVLGWVAVGVAHWYSCGAAAGALLGFPPAAPDAEPVLGLGYFVTPQFIWFYLCCIAFFVLFAGFWFTYAPHPCQGWSIAGTALILFATYFNVQVSVAINDWRRPFFDDVQAALSGGGKTTAADLYGLIPTIAAGKITFGILQQILTAFGQVSASFQYLVNSWTTIIELLSVHKRLRAFEAAFEGRELPLADRDYLLHGEVGKG